MLPFKTILFATDFSPASNVAFNVAAALARDYRARIIALHVVEPAQMGFSEFNAYVGPDEDTGEAMTMLKAIKAPPMVTIEHRLLEGVAATVIVETASEVGADLIVMGTMGRSGLTRLVMGSVAEEVLRRAPCPVLTIRGAVPVKTEEHAEFPEAVAIEAARGEAGECCAASGVQGETLMTTAAIAAFDSTVHMTNHWLNEIMDRMSWNDQHQAYHALRAVLQALRDRLPVNHAAALGAQLPMLVRGIYYESWNPSRTPIKERKKADFLYHIREAFRDSPLVDAEEVTRAVLHVIADHVSKGEVESVKLTLPHEIRELWDEETHTLWF